MLVKKKERIFTKPWHELGIEYTTGNKNLVDTHRSDHLTRTFNFPVCGWLFCLNVWVERERTHENKKKSTTTGKRKYHTSSDYRWQYTQEIGSPGGSTSRARKPTGATEILTNSQFPAPGIFPKKNPQLMKDSQAPVIILSPPVNASVSAFCNAYAGTEAFSLLSVSAARSRQVEQKIPNNESNLSR